MKNIFMESDLNELLEPVKMLTHAEAVNFVSAHVNKSIKLNPDCWTYDELKEKFIKSQVKSLLRDQEEFHLTP